MKQLDEIGTCPKCDFPIYIYKTSQYKRFAKCEGCGPLYPLPRSGLLSNSILTCPLRRFPILIVSKKGTKAYFWSDQPCFSCTHFEKCTPINELIEEFTELEVNGY